MDSKNTHSLLGCKADNELEMIFYGTKVEDNGVPHVCPGMLTEFSVSSDEFSLLWLIKSPPHSPPKYWDFKLDAWGIKENDGGGEFNYDIL
jgi:hypothetical protein